MGNRFSTSSEDYIDPPGPEGVTFFHELELRWFDTVVNRVRELVTDLQLDPFDLSNPKTKKHPYKLQWRDYFAIFTTIKEKIVLDEIKRERRAWHPATTGFMMGIDDSPRTYETTIIPPTPKLVEDDYTDDDMDDDDDGDEDESLNEEEKPKIQTEPIILQHKAVNWDPQITNPIYFGHNYKTVTQFEDDRDKAKEAKITCANRAADKAKNTRSAIIDALEKTMKSQADKRYKI